MGTGEFNAGGNPAMDWHPIQGGVEIFLVASCHGNRDKLRPDGPLGSYADFTTVKQVRELNWSSRVSVNGNSHFFSLFYLPIGLGVFIVKTKEKECNSGLPSR